MCNQWCLEFASFTLPFFQHPARILEVGSCNINGSIRDVLSEYADEYIGVDLFDGPGVNVVLNVADLTDTFKCESFDLVASTEMLEHCLKWQDALYQMISVLRQDGLLLITTRSPGFELHDYPADHWRFSYSDFEKIFQPIGDIIEIKNDMTLGWQCGIGILVKRKLSQSQLSEWKSWLDTFAVYSMKDEMNHSKMNEKLHPKRIIFDISSRYKACSDLLCQTDFVAGNSILDVGSGLECLLGQFMPEATTTYIDPLIPSGSGQDRLAGDIFSHELDGQAFDCVSAVDVLEHVPAEHRQAFIERASALAKSTLILGFPTSDASDAQVTDQLMNKQYQKIFGQNYSWLDEHFQFGLPSLSDVVHQLEKLGWHCQTVGHGYSPWLRELLGFVICTLGNPKLDQIVLDISEQFNRNLYSYDFRAPHYRQFIVASRSQLPRICPPEEISNKIDPEHIFQTLMQDAHKQYFVESLRLLRDQDVALSELVGPQKVAERNRQVNKLSAEAVRLREWALRLDAELKEERAKLSVITHSISWKLTLPLRETRRWVLTPKLQGESYARFTLGLAKRMNTFLSPEFKKTALYKFLLNKLPEKFKASSHLPIKEMNKAPIVPSAGISFQTLMTKLNIPGDSSIILSAIKDTFGEDRYRRFVENYNVLDQLPELFSDHTVFPLVQASELPEIIGCSRRRRILFITSIFPSPHHGGGNRVLNSIKILSENNDIYLSAFFFPQEDEQFLEIVTPYCCSIQKISYFEFGGNQAEIHKWLNGTRMDIIHYEWPQSLLNYDRTFGDYHIFTYMEAVSLRLIMDLNRIEPFSVEWLDKFTELTLNLRIELADASLPQARIAVTTKDGDFFKNLFPYQEYAVLNHGLTFDEFVIPDVEPEPNTLVFVGNYKHIPNEDAMVYFFNEIWEGIRKKIPEVRIYLVGDSPSRQIKRLADNRHIFVTGKVPDVRTYIQKAAICIAPLITGAGLRGKVIEYAALRRTFVATSIATTDLVFRDGIDYLGADTATDFTRKIIHLLNNEQMARKMGDSAFELARKNYDTRRLMDFLNRLYNRLEMN
nr:glycosyltransferase [Desulfobacula sp.]